MDPLGAKRSQDELSSFIKFNSEILLKGKKRLVTQLIYLGVNLVLVFQVVLLCPLVSAPFMCKELKIIIIIVFLIRRKGSSLSCQNGNRRKEIRKWQRVTNYKAGENGAGGLWGEGAAAAARRRS